MSEELPLAALWGARPGLSWGPCWVTPTSIQAVGHKVGRHSWLQYNLRVEMIIFAGGSV